MMIGLPDWNGTSGVFNVMFEYRMTKSISFYIIFIEKNIFCHEH